MDNPYVTYHDDYIESEWWALKQIWDKGLLYKGFKIVPYCPRCGTPLSSHEVAQGYKDVKEKSAIARFKVKGEDAYFLAWTTTPWTLPSNVALCVNPKETYAKVKAADGYTYYMAEALLDTVLGKLADKENGTPAYEILETYTGKDLEYKEYEPLFDCAVEICEKQHKKAYFVTCADYVTLTDGTGVVHIAPAFGEDDAQVGRRYDLPFVQLVDAKGDMTKETPYAGVFVKKADPMVLKDLKEKGYQLKAIKMLLHEEQPLLETEPQPKEKAKAKEKPQVPAATAQPQMAQVTQITKQRVQSSKIGADEKMEQFQNLMTGIVKRAIEENNQALGLAVGEQVGERVLKEMNYLAREQEEQAEERYRRLDEAIRQHHKSKKLFHKKSKDKTVLPKTTQLT